MKAIGQSNKKQKTNSEYKGMAVKVKEFITVQDAFDNVQTGVLGTNVRTGEDVRVFLTVPKTDEIAEKYKDRPTLEKWSGEFNEFGVDKTVDPGAVMYFENCIPFNKKDDPMGEHFKSIWPVRLGDNPDQVAKLFVHGTMVVQGNYKYEDLIKDGEPVMNDKTGEPVKRKTLIGGNVFHFDHKPSSFVIGASGDDVVENLRNALATKENPYMLVRYLDADGKVCAEQFGTKSWTKDADDNFEKLSNEEAATRWASQIDDTMKALPDAASVSIVPVEKFKLSDKKIKNPSNAYKFKEVAQSCLNYKDDEPAQNLQYCFAKRSQKYPMILSKVDTVEKKDKENPAKDPTLLGDLSYAPTFSANMTALAAMRDADQAQDTEQEPAQASSPAP